MDTYSSLVWAKVQNKIFMALIFENDLHEPFPISVIWSLKDSLSHTAPSNSWVRHYSMWHPVAFHILLILLIFNRKLQIPLSNWHPLISATNLEESSMF